MVWDTYCSYPSFNTEVNIGGEYLKDNVNPLPEENKNYTQRQF